MNYVLQVVNGRNPGTTLKLIDGVTVLGRHDECAIRIKSSLVSRRHCQLSEAGGRLMIKDLSSSNGTFVNGKKIEGQQVLKVGDELTVGGITLKVAAISRPVAARKPNDTDIVRAIPTQEEEEFEIALDDGDAATDLDSIPLVDLEPPPPKPAFKGDGNRKPIVKEPVVSTPLPLAEPKQEDEAVAQFLLDLNLDED